MMEHINHERHEDIDEKILEVDNLKQVADFLDNDQITDALIWVIKLITNPNVSAKTANKLIVQFSALSLSCQLQAKDYMVVRKDAPNARQNKELLLTFAKALDELVNALKYVTKAY